MVYFMIPFFFPKFNEKILAYESKLTINGEQRIFSFFEPEPSKIEGQKIMDHGQGSEERHVLAPKNCKVRVEGMLPILVYRRNKEAC